LHKHRRRGALRPVRTITYPDTSCTPHQKLTHIVQIAPSWSICAAISDLNSQEGPNFSSTAKKHNIDRTTLMRRFKHQTVWIQEANSRNLKLLTDEQEEVLIKRILKLSTRGFYLTSQMLRNLAEEIVKHPVSERWSRRFRKRHENQLSSIYLRNIDRVRQVADNSAHFQHYFDTVQGP
jgi:hypothetical protein